MEIKMSQVSDFMITFIFKFSYYMSLFKLIDQSNLQAKYQSFL